MDFLKGLPRIWAGSFNNCANPSNSNVANAIEWHLLKPAFNLRFKHDSVYREEDPKLHVTYE
eukprot:2232128-Amphidinium_carterae.1